MELRVPDLGEGIESAQVTGVLVKPGDSVNAGDPVIEVETDKASMPIPAEQAGTVEEVLANEGDTLNVGDPILKLKAGGGSESKKQDEAKSPPPPPPPSAKKDDQPAGEAKQTDFQIPDLGEGIETATVTSVLVKEGDSVKAQQALLEVETDKANMPIPAQDALSPPAL